MEELAVLLIVLALVVAAIVFVCVTLFWGAQFACLSLLFLSANLLAVFDKALCWTDLISPAWHWAVSGFLLGAILHFALREAPKTNRPRLGAMLGWVAAGICLLSLLLHGNGGKSPRFAVRNPSGGMEPSPATRTIAPAVASIAGVASGETPSPAAEPISERKPLWTYSSGEKLTSVASVDDEGNVYVATHNNLVKLSRAGKVEWDFPKAQQDFTVPVIEDRYVFSGGKDLVALFRSDGSVAWGKAQTAGGPAVAARFSSPAVSAAGALLFFRADEMFSYRLNGGAIWQDSGLRSDPEPATAGGLGDLPLVFGNRACIFPLDNSLGAVSLASGQLTWRFKADANASIGPLAGVGSRIFATCGRSVYCVDSLTGRREWMVTKSHEFNPEVVIDANGELIFGGYDRLYVCRAETGAELTTLYLHHEPGEGMTQSALALGSGNLIYAGGSFGVQCIDRATGDVRWRCRAGQGSVSGLTVCRDGNIVVRASDGIYLLPGDAPKGPEHPWPMLHGNQAHTGAAQEYRPSSRANP
jgi:outer membrane protein assembly factor BamB